MFSLPGSDWNWTAKIFSLLLSALVIVALRLSPEAVGLTLRQNLEEALELFFEVADESEVRKRTQA